MELIFSSLERGQHLLFKKQKISGIGGVVAEIGSFEKNLKFYEPITNPRIFFRVSRGFPKILAAISCKIVLILDFGNSKSLHYIIFRILDFQKYGLHPRSFRKIILRFFISKISGLQPRSPKISGVHDL